MNEINVMQPERFNASLNGTSIRPRTIEGAGVSRSVRAPSGPGPKKSKSRTRPRVLPAIDPENHRVVFCAVGWFENRQVGTSGNFSGKRRGVLG